MSYVQLIGLMVVFFVNFDTLYGYKFDKFLDLEEIYSYMADLCRYSKYVKILNIGETYEKRKIKVLKIDVDTDYYCREKKAIAIEAGASPKTWTAISTAIYIMEQLVKSNNSDLMYLKKQYVWYIVPVLNPDGYVYTWQNERRWEFNRKPYGKCIGVSVNRNFPFKWVYGHRQENCSGVNGDYPLSEMESRSWATLLLDIAEPLHAYFELWTYGSKLVYVNDTQHPLHNQWYDFGLNAAKVFKHKHGKQILVTGFLSNGPAGNSNGWVVKMFKNVELVYSYQTRGSVVLSPQYIIIAVEEIFESLITLIFQSEPHGSE